MGKNTFAGLARERSLRLNWLSAGLPSEWFQLDSLNLVLSLRAGINFSCGSGHVAVVEFRSTKEFNGDMSENN